MDRSFHPCPRRSRLPCLCLDDRTYSFRYRSLLAFSIGRCIAPSIPGPRRSLLLFPVDGSFLPFLVDRSFQSCLVVRSFLLPSTALSIYALTGRSFHSGRLLLVSSVRYPSTLPYSGSPAPGSWSVALSLHVQLPFSPRASLLLFRVDCASLVLPRSFLSFLVDRSFLRMKARLLICLIGPFLRFLVSSAVPRSVQGLAQSLGSLQVTEFQRSQMFSFVFKHKEGEISRRRSTFCNYTTAEMNASRFYIAYDTKVF